MPSLIMILAAILITVIVGGCANDGNVVDLSHFLPLSDFNPQVSVGMGDVSSDVPIQRQNMLPGPTTSTTISGITFKNSSSGLTTCQTISGIEFCN